MLKQAKAGGSAPLKSERPAFSLINSSMSTKGGIRTRTPTLRSVQDRCRYQRYSHACRNPRLQTLGDRRICPSETMQQTPYSIAPWLSVRNGARAVDFYKSAFGAIETYRVEDPTGSV